jgi:hypothetical protein
MTAIAVDLRTRDARIYRVNAWREMKGRPELTFPEPKEAEGLVPGGPEWWTEANTRAWNVQQWGVEDVSEAQGIWKAKMDGARKAGPLCYKVIPAKEMAKWRKNDPRPTPVTFYDGRIDAKRSSLATADTTTRRY